MAEIHIDPGTSLAMPKAQLDALLARLRERGYQTIGPKLRDNALQYLPLQTMAELPRVVSARRTPAEPAGTQRPHAVLRHHPRPPYLETVPLPPRLRDCSPSRKTVPGRKRKSVEPASRYAFIGSFRGCDLAAISIQDRVFLREDFSDPLYRAAAPKSFLLSVSWMAPGGPLSRFDEHRAAPFRGFDINLTELEDVFLLETGSELGCQILEGFQPASAFLCSNPRKGVGIGRRVAPRAGYQRSAGLARPAQYGTSALERRRQALPTPAPRARLSARPVLVGYGGTPGLETGASTSRGWQFPFQPGYDPPTKRAATPAPPFVPDTANGSRINWAPGNCNSTRLGCVGCGRCITPGARSELTSPEEIDTLRKQFVPQPADPPP